MGKNWQDDFLKAAGFLLLVFLAIHFLMQTLVSSGKLHGNEFALNQCKWQIRIWKNAETNSPNFDFYKLADEDKKRVVFMGFKPMFWMKTNFIWGGKSSRAAVIICNNEYDNVPTPAFWNFFHRNPAHAVGYSDGTTGLISPEQFTNMNLNGFVSLSDLATNSEFNIFR